MSYSEIYFAVATVSTIAVGGLLILCFTYILSILMDIKKLSKLARREAEVIARNIAKGASIFGAELSQETAGFVKTIFGLLLTQFAKGKKPKSKRARDI